MRREYAMPAVLDRMEAALEELSNVATVGEKERLIERSLELRRAMVPPDSIAIAGSLNTLGILAAERGALDPAIRHYRESLEILHRSVGASHPYALAVQSNLAAVVALTLSGCATIPLVQAALRSLAERPSRISWVSRFAAVRASISQMPLSGFCQLATV